MWLPILPSGSSKVKQTLDLSLVTIWIGEYGYVP
jgi:hypothetical protein